MQRRGGLEKVGGLALGFAVGAVWLAGLAQPRTPTYYQDVKPILEAQCVGCHKPGGIAPFSLTEPQDAVARAQLIAAVTASGRMPPWPPGPDSPEFLDQRKLTEAQKATLAAWAQAGAPLGQK
ncbi:MAG: hypothetical protein K6T70_06960 [Meiothermus ruber]|uniref:hypothetical protein n=1 Tax=Meiothermus ruber TaxID=277 RepID=UPI0023F67C37|nr:hypothetical protein [Meiothermus ruber]MCL6529842.1 hypothetical protein [Meiothermus ruber]